MKKLSLYILMWLCLGVTGLSAQEERSEIYVDFRVNATHIDLAFGENAERLAQITRFLNELRNDSTISILNVSFCGAASPEGSYQLNKRLARGRLEALEKAVRSRVDIPDSIISRDDGYIPWKLLLTMMRETDFPYEEEVRMILARQPELVKYRHGEQIDSRILQLQKLEGGKVWKELHRCYFARMRNSSVVFVTYRRKVSAGIEPAPVRLSDKAVVSPIPVLSPMTMDPAGHSFCMAVKTNLLFDALLVPNVGVEFYLGKDWSLATNWMYAWWSKENKHRYWRVYGGDIALRKWFGSKAKVKPLTGHHLGVYVQTLTYDFEFGGKGYMGGEPGGNILDRASYAAGIEYGYSLPIAQRLNLDFTLGIGYLGGKYYEYIPLDNRYVWQATKQRRWLGPTKAEVSLVWLLGRGNENRKGGAQ